MLTKEQWDLIKIQTEIPIEIFFEFYKEKGGYIEDLNTFIGILHYSITNGIVTNGKIVSYQSMIRNLYNYYDQKFSSVA